MASWEVGPKSFRAKLYSWLTSFYPKITQSPKNPQFTQLSSYLCQTLRVGVELGEVGEMNQMHSCHQELQSGHE